jgi:hypothetical protein
MSSGLPLVHRAPTAYFKSLSGQVERVKQAPLLVFATAGSRQADCDHDLGEFLAGADIPR